MAVKTITITENAYEILKSKKKENESFSKTIVRMFGRPSLMQFAGCLSKESADKLEHTIKLMRGEDTKVHEKRIGNLVKILEGK